MRKVAVFFGGKSCENEISVLTGVFVLNVLDGSKWDVLPVYIHTDGGMYTSKRAFDVEVFKKRSFAGFERVFFDGGAAYVFCGGKKVKGLGKVDAALNCCHGGLGEGGGVSALMEMNGIPLASPSVAASGVFMDKAMTKIVAKGLNVPTVEFLRVTERDYRRRSTFVLKAVGARLKFPVIVKPARLGSSIGIVVAENEEELKRGIEGAFELDDLVLVEKFLQGKKDVNCAAYSLGGEVFVSEPEEAFSGKVYGFAEKYLSGSSGGGLLSGCGGGGCVGGGGSVGDGCVSAGGGRKSCRGKGISGELRDRIRAYTKTLYKKMGLVGVVRMDFLVCGEKAYLGEVNTVPGSLAYYLFCERITDARAFFGDLIEDALARGKEEKKIVTTGILGTVKWRRK